MPAGLDYDAEQMGDGRLIVAVVIIVLLSTAQIVGGIIAGSLSLIADSLHDLNDAVSLAIAIAARRIARRPDNGRRTFGHYRAEIIGALIFLPTLVMVGL